MNKKNIIQNLILIAMVTSLLLCACGDKASLSEVENVSSEGEEIELLEPVGASLSYDVAAYRNLYDSTVFSSTVVPKISEFSTTKSQVFDRFAVSCGDVVNKQDKLVYFKTQGVDKSIRLLQEEIDDFESDYLSNADILNKRIGDAEESVFRASSKYMENFTYEPPVENESAHYGWEKVVLPSEGAYKRELLAEGRLKQQQLENSELYLLEKDYYSKKMQLLQNENSLSAISSNIDGEVVAIGYYYDGDNIEKDRGIIAVGDTTTKMIKTDYITKETVAKAEDLYAIINGKRYELVYEPMDSIIYNQLIKQDGVAYSSFYIDDPADEVKFGDYVVLVLVKESRREVLTIPQDALTKENNEYYVYVYDGENSIYTSVEVGFKDGVYAEILSGLLEGDKVLTNNVSKKGNNTLTLKKDKCFTQLDTTGYLYYPTSEWVRNPVENGTTYVKEILVEENELVSKNQTLVKLEVVADEIEIERLSREIDRAQTRLVPMLEEKETNADRNIIDRGLEEDIINTQKNIDRDLRALNKLTKYRGILEIKAPYDGVISDKITIEEGDLIYEDDRLVRISDNSSLYVVVKDTNDQLAYGNEVTLKYKDINWNEKTTTGKVVTVGNTSLTSSMRADFKLIAIPLENQGDIAISTQASTGNWDRASIKVSLESRCMDNVIVIPKSAVKMENNRNYVTVVNSDGSVMRQSFISGGGNMNSYWVADGLTEGMTICWE